MSTALEKMQVEVKDREIVFTRMFDAPRQMVWDAFTKAEHLEKWWGPHNFTNKNCHVDLRVGGKFETTMVGMGGEFPCLLLFEEIVPIEKIVWYDKVIPGDFWGPDGPPADSRLTLLFEDHGQRTKLISITNFVDNIARDKTMAMGAAQGWAESFERLDEQLSQ